VLVELGISGLKWLVVVAEDVKREPQGSPCCEEKPMSGMHHSCTTVGRVCEGAAATRNKVESRVAPNGTKSSKTQARPLQA